MGSRQAKTVSIVNMAVGGIVVCVVGAALLAGWLSDSVAVFGFLCGVSNLFYGFTVYRALTDAEPDEATFYGLRKRAGSSWLVPTLMTFAPIVSEHELSPVAFVAGLCAIAVSVLLDVCLRNGTKGR